MNHFKGALFEYPQAHPYMCSSLFLMHDPAEEIAVTSGQKDEHFDRMMDYLWKKGHPDRIFAYYPPAPLENGSTAGEQADLASKVPLLEGRISEKEPARGFICKNLTCEEPVKDAKQFILKLS